MFTTINNSMIPAEYPAPTRSELDQHVLKGYGFLVIYGIDEFPPLGNSLYRLLCQILGPGTPAIINELNMILPIIYPHGSNPMCPIRFAQDRKGDQHGAFLQNFVGWQSLDPDNIDQLISMNQGKTLTVRQLRSLNKLFWAKVRR